MVPGCEKNKSLILSRAAEYIQQLKDAEAANIEKWTLESALSNQAMQELTEERDHLQSLLANAEDEILHLRAQIAELQSASPNKRTRLE